MTAKVMDCVCTKIQAEEYVFPTVGRTLIVNAYVVKGIFGLMFLQVLNVGMCAVVN